MTAIDRREVEALSEKTACANERGIMYVGGDLGFFMSYSYAISSMLLLIVGFEVGGLVTCEDLVQDLFFRMAVGGIWTSAVFEALLIGVLFALSSGKLHAPAGIEQRGSWWACRRAYALPSRLFWLAMQTIASAMWALLVMDSMGALRYDTSVVEFVYDLPYVFWPAGMWLGISPLSQICPSVGFHFCTYGMWLPIGGYFGADWFA